MPQELGRALMIVGVVLLVVGLVVANSDRIPYLGRLPGDIVVRKKNFTLYVPLATSLLISLLLAAILRLWPRR